MKKVLGVFAVVFIMLVSIAMLTACFGGNDENGYVQEQFDSNSEDATQELINVLRLKIAADPMDVEAYADLTDAYIMQNDLTSAFETLDIGYASLEGNLQDVSTASIEKLAIAYIELSYAYLVIEDNQKAEEVVNKGAILLGEYSQSIETFRYETFGTSQSSNIEETFALYDAFLESSIAENAFFALEDFNGDGVPELIVALPEDISTVGWYHVFANVNGEIQTIIEASGLIGSPSDFNTGITFDGKWIGSGNNRWGMQTSEYISWDGTTVNYISSAYYFEDKITKYYQNENEISEDQFLKFRASALYEDTYIQFYLNTGHDRQMMLSTQETQTSIPQSTDGQVIFAETIDFLGKTYDEIQSQYGEIISGDYYNGGLTYYLADRQRPVMFFGDDNVCHTIFVLPDEVFSTPYVSFQELVDSLQANASNAQVNYNEMDRHYAGSFNYVHEGQTYTIRIEDIGETSQINDNSWVWISIPF